MNFPVGISRKTPGRKELIRFKKDLRIIWRNSVYASILTVGIIAGTVLGDWAGRGPHETELELCVSYCDDRMLNVLMQIDIETCAEWHYTDNGWEGVGLLPRNKIKPGKRKEKK